MSNKNERDESYFHDRSATWLDLAVALAFAIAVVVIIFTLPSVLL